MKYTYLYPEARERFPGLPSAAVTSIIHSVERRYRAARFKLLGRPKFVRFWYQAGSWLQERFVVVKCEATPRGTNRRAVVTNRPGAELLPAATYDDQVFNLTESSNCSGKIWIPCTRHHGDCCDRLIRRLWKWKRDAIARAKRRRGPRSRRSRPRRGR